MAFGGYRVDPKVTSMSRLPGVIVLGKLGVVEGWPRGDGRRSDSLHVSRPAEPAEWDSRRHTRSLCGVPRMRRRCLATVIERPEYSEACLQIQ